MTPPKEPAVRDVRPRDHVTEHLFQGVCICPCTRCTATVGGDTKCICADCLPANCGLKVKGKLAQKEATG